MARFRRLKRQLASALFAEQWEQELGALSAVPAQQLIGPLFAMLVHPAVVVRWHAVSAFGPVVMRLVREDGLESARVVMRRFMWHMNEESGNIGWGIPEAMGEVMAWHEQLAVEFHKKLGSYVMDSSPCVGDTNFLDHPPLRTAVYWGLARLAQERPAFVEDMVPVLAEAVRTEALPASQACALWALSFLQQFPRAGRVVLCTAFENNATAVTLYRNRVFECLSLADLAREVLQRASGELLRGPDERTGLWC